MSHFEIVEIGDAVDILTGYAFKSDDYVEPPKGLRLLRGDNVTPWKIRWKDAVACDNATPEIIAKYGLEPGDFVIAMDRTWIKQGLKCAVIRPSDTPSLLVQRVARLRQTAKLHRTMIPVLFQSPRFKDHVFRFQTETAVPHISKSDIQSYPIPKIPLDLQVAIGRTAATFDQNLNSISRSLGKSALRKAGLMRELLSGRRRFLEFVESEERIRDGWLERPSDWPFKALSEFAREANKKPVAEDIPVLSSTKYDGLVDSLTYFGRRVYSDDTSNYKLVRRGQFAYATNHIEEGSIGLLQHREAGLVSPMYTVFAIDGDALPSFLFPLFKSERYVHRFGAMTNGSVNRRGGLRWTDFRLLKVALPSVVEQSKIVELIELLNAEIKLLKRQRAAIEKQKRGVMERLLSGEVIIPEDVVERLNLEAEEEERQRAKDAKRPDATTENAS
ncbi:MAG: hypothetical protein WD468_12890 [Pirellulales bacterium]